jgi:small ligand-binding sensory domain FIST
MRRAFSWGAGVVERDMNPPEKASLMAPFPYAHASNPDWRRVVEQVIADLAPAVDGRTPTLGFVYATDAVNAHFEQVLAMLRAATGVSHWVGATGIGICATGVEYYEEPALAVMLADLPADSFRVFPPVVKDLGGFDVAQRDWLGERKPFIGLVHGDPSNPLTESLIRQLAERTAAGFLVGGLASSESNARVVADAPAQGGIAGVTFTDQVPIQTTLTQGCSPIGPHRVMTEVQRNVLIQIDGRPALDVFREDIGEVLARDLSRVGGYIFAGLPIPGSDTGDYLVRNLLGVDVEQKLLAIGDLVEQGQQIMFCRRDGDTARDDLNRMLEGLAGRLSGPPRGGIYISCLGRGVNLFGDDSAELRLVQDRLGDFPLVGFYANGEISQNRLYGYTGVLMVFEGNA